MTNLDEYVLERLPDGKCRVRLVPVEIFGMVCDHDAHRGESVPFGYGLCDAVQSWSDCNRADGRIFRLDENWTHREPGEFIEAVVDEGDLPKFLHNWNSEPGRSPTLVVTENCGHPWRIEPSAFAAGVRMCNTCGM